MDKQQYAAALEKQYGKLSQSELSELIRDNERKINSAERPDIAAGYARQNQYLAKMYRSKSNSANNRKNDAKNNNSSGSSKSSSNSLSTSYSPLTGLKTVNEPISRMKNRTNSSGKKSGSATGGGKAADRSPAVFGAYSPVAGVPDPLERLRNRISGGTKEAADSYRGGAARRRTNVPAAGKTVDPVTADYLSRISQLARTLEKHRLSSGSDFDKILSFNRVLARQEKEDRDNAYENALLKQFGSFSSSQLRERIEQNERAISAANRPDVAAGYERQNKILARWMLERQAKEKADSFLSLKNNADFKQTAAERKAGLLDSDFKYINNIDNERSKAKAARGLNAGISGARLDNLEQLTAEETEIYNYLHNTQGNRAAKEYLDYLEPDLNARRAKKDSARAKAFAKEHPHLSDVFSVLEAPARAVGSAAAVIDDIAGAANGKKVDVNSVYRAGSNAVGAAREVTNKKWEDKINVNLPVIGNLGSFLHGAVLSGLDSAMMMLTGGAVGGALGKTAQGAEAIAKAVVSVGLSSELASSEIVANKAKGYSDLRAVGLGLANGLTEALSEKFSLDVIMKGSPKGALAAMGRSFLAEGSEEVASSAANMAIDAMVNGSDSDIKKRIAEYKQAGEGDFGAVSKALADFIVPEFLAGGLSGSAMGGVHYGMSGKSQKAGGKNSVTFDDIVNAGKEQRENVQNGTGAKNGADDGILYAINYDENNVPFVEVENDVLAGLNQKEKQAKVKEILKDRFSQGVSVGNEQIQITKKSRDEFLNSKYTNTLKRKQPSVYDDKLRSSDNLDEIVKASRDYVGEGLKHPRKDSIREFARGTVNLRVGGKDYSADVVVGTKSDDSLVFYDLINFKPAKINERAPVTRMVNKNDSTNSLDWNALSDSSIPQTTENYNPEMQKNSDENGPVYSVNPEGAEQRESQAPAMQENEAAVGGKAQEASMGAFRRVVEALGYKVIDTPRAERVDAMLQKYQNDSESRKAFWQGQQGSRSVPGGEKTLWDKGGATERQEVFPTGETDRSGVWPDVDGYVDYKLGEVYINPNAQNPQNVVMKHELTHVMERVSTKYLKQASDYIKTTLPEVWERTREQVINKYDRLGIDVSEHLESETMAEIASEFSTDKAINRYGTSARFCRNISLWFSYMAKKIKSIFGDLTVADKLEIAAYKWEQALRQAEKQAKMGTNSGTDGVVFYASSDKRSASIRDQLKANMKKIMAMPVVKRVTFDTDVGSGIEQQKKDMLKRIQNIGDGNEAVINRKGFGPVEVGYREIKSGLKYLSTKEEIASVDAISDVIRNGIQIWSNDNHKGREYPTFTFAAPIELNGKLYSMAVVVKRTSANKYKVHRVLMPDGAALEFSEAQNNDIKTKEAEATPNQMTAQTDGESRSITSASNEAEATFTQMTAQMDGESRAITSASDDSVSQDAAAVNNNFMQNEENDATLDFLLAGERAKTHDPAALDKAKRLSAFGETPRQIWKETGWVKGQEGKWRFELDDSKMKFRKKDGKICDVLRISELNFQSMTEGLSDAESDEFLRLRQAASRGELSAPLSDVISYDLLFEAYPALKEVLVKSDYHAIGMGKAAFDPGTKTIYLSPQANGAKLRQTLLHEIQHAVQDEEGFSFGSSPDYWRERSGISAKEAERLYENTAGEIEARDVERRADLTEEERRETFPASAEPNDDVVFAGEETGNAFVLYHADSAESDAAGIISKLKEHLQDIARQPKVFHVKKNVLDGLGEKASEAIGNYFNSIGNKAVNPEIGVVELSKRGAKSTVFHGTSSEKLKAVGAIKDVIEKGTIFDFEKNWKNRGYDTYLIAANGTVMGQPRALGVVVKAYPGSNMNNKFYLHEVIEMELTHHLDAAADNGVTHVSKSTPIDSVSQGETSVNSYSMQTQENNAFDRILRMSGGSKEKRITFDDLLEA
ncbi:LPD23 domain-containing protein [Congzhengia minquanensis]|uniref:Large polyvalent protein-associated domain-containing protein n=1 Tax=Congzhengia minquanensis TaxID=2763657 RepID=A0A926DMC2_9FIRM|nr:LPD23 domain-containing protein [Congzhengia minquanensis]MBC8541628.1 hypothetical protein [Congzhengia minquanensis]